MMASTKQIVNVTDLTPLSRDWRIKGGVTTKSGIREYSNARGTGKVFNFSIADKSAEIKVTDLAGTDSLATTLVASRRIVERHLLEDPLLS